MKPVVRQMRGPGMNKGLKKPRHGTIKKVPETKSSKAAHLDAARGSTRSQVDQTDYSKKSGSYLAAAFWQK